MRPKVRIFVLLLLILILTEGRAQAYVDPGTGSMVWQLLFAGVVGVVFYIRKVLGWMGSFRRKKKDDVGSTSPPP
jgi:hypothetical protein